MKSLCWRKISPPPPMKSFCWRKELHRLTESFFFSEGRRTGENVMCLILFSLFLFLFSLWFFNSNSPLCGYIQSQFCCVQFQTPSLQKKIWNLHTWTCMQRKKNIEIYIIEMKYDSESRARSSCCPNPAIGRFYSLQIQSLLEMVEASWSRISW